MGCYNRWFYQDFTGRQKYFSTWQEVAKTKYEYYVISNAAWPQCFHICPIRCHIICILRSPCVRLCWLFISEASWGLAARAARLYCASGLFVFAGLLVTYVHTAAAVQALYNTYRVRHTETCCLGFTSMKCSKAFVIWVIRGHLAEPIGQYNSLKIGVLFTECCEGAMTLIIKYWTWTRTSIDKIRFSVKMCNVTNVCCFFSIWDMFCTQKCEEVTVN